MLINTPDNKLMCELYDLLKQSLNGFKASATRQGIEKPDFNVMQFLEWVYNQPEFETISKLWIESNYSKMYKPKMVIKVIHDYRYQLSNFKLSNYEAIERTYKESKEKKI